MPVLRNRNQTDRVPRGALIQANREQYEAKLARKEADVSKREADIKVKLDVVEQANSPIEEQVAERLKNRSSCNCDRRIKEG